MIVTWMGAALTAREKGVPLVNIAQPYKKAGMQLVCPKDGPVQTEADFKGKTLGVWFFGNEYPFYAWMSKLGLSTEGGPDGVTVLKQSFDVQPLIQKQADCISVMTYNEYWQLIDAGYKPEDLIVFNYTAMGVDLLEDGLYVMEDKLKDPAFRETMVKFVTASMKGWEYAIANPGRGRGYRGGQWRPGREPPEAYDGRGGQADRQAGCEADRGRLPAHRRRAAGAEDHRQPAFGRLDIGNHRRDEVSIASTAAQGAERSAPFFVRLPCRGGSG